MKGLPKKITILYTASGGGHKAAAEALKAILERDGLYSVSVVNVYAEIIPNLDGFRFTPFGGEEIYNRFVQGRGWTGLFALMFYGVVIGSIYLQWKMGLRQLESYWRAEKPDLVISVIPLLNTLLSRSLQSTRIPFMVVMTDLKEPQKFTWLPGDNTTTIVCGTHESYDDAIKKPHPPSLVHETSGLPVNPAFYDQNEIHIAESRMGEGLQSDLPTGCMLYGGSGSRRMVDLAKALISLEEPFQMIFLCGRHEKTAEAIRNLKLPYPHLILGYTKEMSYYMKISDFFIGKPGPGSLNEALVMELPVLLDCKKLLLQERYNIQWIEQKQIGTSFRSRKEFQKGIRHMLDSGNRDEMVKRISNLNNRAIFTIPSIVEEVLTTKF